MPAQKNANPDADIGCELWTCVKYVPKQSIPYTLKHHSFGHVWSMYRSSPFRSTLNTSFATALDTCEYAPKQPIPKHFEHEFCHSFGHVWSMYRSSPFRSTLNTRYITALDMCEVGTEAIHSIPLWTRVTSHLWTCVKYPDLPIDPCFIRPLFDKGLFFLQIRVFVFANKGLFFANKGLFFWISYIKTF